jgi:hypothetical protein
MVKQVNVRVPMGFSFARVTVPVIVHKVAGDKQRRIPQYCLRLALCSDTMGFVHHVHPIGDCLDDAQVVRTGDDRPPHLRLIHDKVHQPGLTAGVKASRGLIHEPNLWIEAED